MFFMGRAFCFSKNNHLIIAAGEKQMNASALAEKAGAFFAAGSTPAWYAWLHRGKRWISFLRQLRARWAI
jgi:hypothetical protein